MRSFKHPYLFFFILGMLFVTKIVVGQHKNLPLNFNLNQQLEYNYVVNYDTNTIVHTASKPLVETFVDAQYYASIYNDTNKYYYAFTEKLFQKNLLSVEEKELKLVADPLFNIAKGYTSNGDTAITISNNIRGVRVAGDITNKFSFETRVYEAQFFYPMYLDSIADYKTTALGFGRSKTFKGRGHDVAMSMGYVSYSPTKHINLQFGHGKHFIGNGYRSLLLSDNTAPAPYLSFTTQFFKNKIQYKNINTWMQTLTRLPVTNSAEALFKRKGASFRYLSFALVKNLQFGLFEGVIHQNYVDSVGQVPLNASFYIPVIGVASVVAKANSSNALLGANISYQLRNSFLLYGQVAYDEVGKKTKLGTQIGLKWYNVGAVKNSWVQVEYNSVPNFMYSTTSSTILQNYVHTNQELAHPLGSGFSELLLIGHAEYDRVLLTAKMVFQQQNNLDSLGLGTNILLANNLPKVGEEVKTNTILSGLECSYLFNRKTNMQLFGNYYYRSSVSKQATKVSSKFESFWQIGFRTTLINQYRDI